MISDKTDTIAMIPARMGSERLKKKNIALLDGRPLVSYAIDAAVQSGVFDRIVLNADDGIFTDIAKMHGIECYLRPESLGSSDTKSDQVVFDFIDKFPCKTITWVNSTSPLQPSSEIQSAVEFFLRNNIDSLFTVENKKLHVSFEGQPINFNKDDLFAKTQDLAPVSCFVYSLMMWNTGLFKEHYKASGHAFFIGQTAYYPVSKATAMLVKTKEDLDLVECIMQQKKKNNSQLKYFSGNESAVVCD